MDATISSLRVEILSTIGGLVRTAPAVVTGVVAVDVNDVPTGVVGVVGPGRMLLEGDERIDVDTLLGVVVTAFRESS